jgi:hypothetical protein
MDDTSALTPHLGCAKGISACHPCQALEALAFPAFSTTFDHGCCKILIMQAAHL